MGCDIHIVAELRKGRVWQPIPRGLFTGDDHDRAWPGQGTMDWPFSWRSYNLFAVLAGVRNQHRMTPIAAPRGLPDDLSQEGREILGWDNAWWKDMGHHASWLSVADLLDHPHYDEPAGSWDIFGPDDRPRESIPVTTRDRLGERFFEEIEILRGLHEDPRNVRIVFFFDN